jgi:2-hydroxy-6-oxonona-2,4-dienedioate hydrolase
VWRTHFAADLERARTRVGDVESRRLPTPWGTVEYSVAGSGPPVLMSHGIFGGHADGLGMIATYVGTECLAIAPARFGYFGSSLPRNASPGRQADAYAAVLDDLEVERALAIGFSAGGPSAIEFALRHPSRVTALVLVASALPPSSRPPRFARPLMRAALSREAPFWLFKTLLPRTFRGLLGVPHDYEPTPAEQAAIDEVGASVLPVRPRRDGVLFDAFVGNPSVRTARLEAIDVPTLLIHASDDALAPYSATVDAAVRIPHVTFVTIDTGGHLFLSKEARVRDEIRTFMAGLASAGS